MEIEDNLNRGPDTELHDYVEAYDSFIGPEDKEKLLKEPFQNIQEVYIVLGQIDKIDPADPEYGYVHKQSEVQFITSQFKKLTRGMELSDSYRRFVEKAPLPSDHKRQPVSIEEKETERDNRLRERGTQYAKHMLAIHDMKYAYADSDEFRQRYGVQTDRNVYEDIVDHVERVRTLFQEFQTLLSQKAAIIAVAAGREELDDVIASQHGEDVLEIMSSSLSEEVTLMISHLPDLIGPRNDRKKTISETAAEAIRSAIRLQTDTIYDQVKETAQAEHIAAVNQANARLEAANADAGDIRQAGYVEADSKKQEKIEDDIDDIQDEINGLLTPWLQDWFKTSAGKDYRNATTGGSGEYDSVYDELTAMQIASALPAVLEFKEHWEISEQSRQQRRGASLLGRMRADKSETPPPILPASNVGAAAVRQAADRPTTRTSTSNFTGLGVSRARPAAPVMAPSNVEVDRTTREMFDIKAALKVPEHGQLIATRILVAKILQKVAYANLSKDEIFRQLESADSPYKGLLRGTDSGKGPDPQFRKVLDAAYGKRQGSTRSDIFSLINDAEVQAYFTNQVLEDPWFQKNWMEDYGITQDMLTINTGG